MTIDIQEVRTHHFTSEDRLLLDANIWMYVYGPNAPDYYLTRLYSQVLSRILEVKCLICIDVLVVSEFINRFARIKWGIEGRCMGDFKKYRKSPAYHRTAIEIADNTRRILRHCHRLESGFQELDVDMILESFATGQNDFNDQIIANICKDCELTLITHDADFKGDNISILTANSKLLA